MCINKLLTKITGFGLPKKISPVGGLGLVGSLLDKKSKKAPAKLPLPGRSPTSLFGMGPASLLEEDSRGFMRNIF